MDFIERKKNISTFMSSLKTVKTQTPTLALVVNWKTWAQLIPAIKAKGSGAGFSPPVLLPVSILLGGGEGLLLSLSGRGVSVEGGASWEVG